MKKFLIIRTNCDCASGWIARQEKLWKYGPRCPHCGRILGPFSFSVVDCITASSSYDALKLWRTMGKKKLFIVEHVSGVWYYHLSETGKSGQPALCGNTQVMSTEIPISSWGSKGHLNEKYCKECENVLQKKLGVAEKTFTF
jgi:hypothetical protein